jgi:hypothetical protein
MSAEMDDDDDYVVIVQDDPDCQGVTQLADVPVGESFIFRGKILTKRNEYGWFMGVCNVVNENGDISHLHPTTRVCLIN